MRNMSFMLTTEQIRNRTKTVTRRLGWKTLRPGDRIAACKQCMGLKKGQAVEQIAILRVISVRQERLSKIIDEPGGCKAEGFPDMSPDQFMDFFCRSHDGCRPHSVITRIEFAYCEDGAR